MERSKYKLLRKIFDTRFSVNEFLSYAEHYTEQVREKSRRRYIQRVIGFVQEEADERWKDGRRLPVFDRRFLDYVLRETTKNAKREQVQEVRAA